jgi:hypothetical protein
MKDQRGGCPTMAAHAAAHWLCGAAAMKSRQACGVVGHAAAAAPAGDFAR